MLSAAEKKSEANKRAYEKRKAKLAAASASLSVADVPKVPSPKYMKSVAKKQSAPLELPSPAPAPTPTPTPTVKKTPMTDAEKKAKRAEYNKRAYEKKKAGLTTTKSAVDAPATKSVAKKTPAKKSVAKPSPAPSPSVFELMAPPKIITPATIASQKASLKQKPAPSIYQGENLILFVRDGVKYWLEFEEDDIEEDVGDPRAVYDYYDKTYVGDYFRDVDEFVPLSVDINYEWKWEKWEQQNQEIAKMDAMLALTPAEYANYLKTNKKKAAPPPEKKPPRPLFAFELRALPPAEYAKYMKAQKGKEAYQRKKAAEAPAERGPGRPEKFKPMTFGRYSPDLTPEQPPKILTPVDDDEDAAPVSKLVHDALATFFNSDATIPVSDLVYDRVTYSKSEGDTTDYQNIWGNLYRRGTREHIGYYNEWQQLPMSFKHLNPVIDIDDVDGVLFTFQGEFNKELLIAITPIKPYTHEVFDPVISRKVGVVIFGNDYDPTLDKIGYGGGDEPDELVFDPIYVKKRLDGKKYWLNASDEEAWHGEQVYIRDFKTKKIVGEYHPEDGTHKFYKAAPRDDTTTVAVRKYVYDGKTYFKSDSKVTDTENIWGKLYDVDTNKHIGYYNEMLKLPMFLEQMNPEVDLEEIDTKNYIFQGEVNKEMLIAVEPYKPGKHNVFDPAISRKVGVATFDSDYDVSLDRLGNDDKDDTIDQPYIHFDPIYVTKIINGKKYWLDASDDDAQYGMPSRIYDYDTYEDVGGYDNDTGEAWELDDEEESDEDSLGLDTDSDDDVMLGALTKKVAGITLDPMKPPTFS